MAAIMHDPVRAVMGGATGVAENPPSPQSLAKMALIKVPIGATSGSIGSNSSAGFRDCWRFFTEQRLALTSISQFTVRAKIAVAPPLFFRASNQRCRGDHESANLANCYYVIWGMRPCALRVPCSWPAVTTIFALPVSKLATITAMASELSTTVERPAPASVARSPPWRPCRAGSTAKVAGGGPGGRVTPV